MCRRNDDDDDDDAAEVSIKMLLSQMKQQL
jgi:hypothetical protein